MEREMVIGNNTIQMDNYIVRDHLKMGMRIGYGNIMMKMVLYRPKEVILMVKGMVYGDYIMEMG
jgi:hypothetical protein